MFWNKNACAIPTQLHPLFETVNTPSIWSLPTWQINEATTQNWNSSDFNGTTSSVRVCQSLTGQGISLHLCRFSTALETVHFWTQSWASWIHFSPFDSVFLRSGRKVGFDPWQGQGFSSYHHVHIGFNFHPGFCSVVAEGSFPGDKAVPAWWWLLISILCQG